MNLESLAQLATWATPGEVSAHPGVDGYVNEFIAAANPSVVLALVEVCRAAKSVIHPKLDEWSFPRWDEASAKAVAESKLRDALAKLDNLGGTE